jgi:hypothetical protein
VARPDGRKGVAMVCHPPSVSRAACHWPRRILRAEGQCAQMLRAETFATPFADALRACHTSHNTP